MELIKKNVHMNRLKSHIVSQITLDDDFNVPDINEDIYKIITRDGNITGLQSRVSAGKVSVSGTLEFKFLYGSADDGGKIHHMSGNIPFTETINCDNVDDHDGVTVKWDIDDLNIGIINTRKISVKALVSLSLSCEDIFDMETAVLPEGASDLLALEKTADVTQLAVCKKDILRVKESMELPSGKPNISEIIWSSACLKSASSRLMDGRLSVSGDLLIFILYNTEDENAPVQWYENTFPFSGVLELPGCDEDMIVDVSVNISEAGISIKSDMDGEPRIIDADIVLDLNIKIYNEEEVSFIVDAYSTSSNITPTYNTVTYNTILTKNISKCKISDRLKLNASKGQVLQLLNVSPQPKIDDISIGEDGLTVEGIVSARIMYISSDDKSPLAIADEVIPFTHTVEAKGIKSDSLCFIRPSLEQVNANMTGMGEVEVKGEVVLDCLIINNNSENVISDIEAEPFDSEWLSSRPGMVGYRVRENDSLWDIAKKFHTTKEHITSLNELKSEMLSPGEMLLV